MGHHFARRTVGGDEAAEPVTQLVRVVHADGVERGDHPRHRHRVDFVRVGRHLQVGVLVADVLIGIGDEGVQVVADQLGRGRRAHAEGEGQAGVLGHAVVRHVRRQVQHVARRQHPVVGGLEHLQQLQFHVRAEAQRRALALDRFAGVDLPAAVAVGLQQEHVVLVDMGTDRATGGGEADHHVIHAPARQEVEVFDQRAHVRVPLVDVLHEQGPVVVGQGREHVFLERAAAHAPAVLGLVVLDQARQHAFLAGQPGQVFRLHRGLEIGEGVADQQRALLPEVAQEGGRGHAQRLAGAGGDFDEGGGGLAGGHGGFLAAESGRGGVAGRLRSPLSAVRWDCARVVVCRGVSGQRRSPSWRGLGRVDC